MRTQDIWKLYNDDVKRFILSKTKNESVTDDLLQETFIKVHTKLDTVKDITKLKSWVFSVARNTTLDYFRSNSKKIEISPFDPLTESEINTHSEKDCLLAHILNLDIKYRTPLFLSDIKGIKQNEISNQLNLPLSTVKSRIQRARKKVAKGYMDCCGYSLNKKGVLVGEIQHIDDCKICS